jgi:hypothetical protein
MQATPATLQSSAVPYRKEMVGINPLGSPLLFVPKVTEDDAGRPAGGTEKGWESNKLAQSFGRSLAGI